MVPSKEMETFPNMFRKLELNGIEYKLCRLCDLWVTLDTHESAPFLDQQRLNLMRRELLEALPSWT
jgi:hypothetical protein